MTAAVVMGKLGWLNEEAMKLVEECWVVDDWMEGVSCAVVHVADWFVIDGIGAWVVREGLTPDEKTVAVELGREVLIFVGLEALFEIIEINTEDQYPTCLAA